LQLLNAVQMPRLGYDAMKRRFELVREGEGAGEEKRSFFGGPSDKVDMLRQRYALVHQRMLRQDLFRPNLLTANGRPISGGAQNGGGGDEDCHKITPIEGLLGRSGVKILLGMVAQAEEGQYYLEDPTAQIPISLTQTQLLTTGFITEQSIVLVEGELIDGTLLVHKIGHPIFEPRRNALDAIGLRETDIFGAIPTLAELAKLRVMEEQHGCEGMFVILSDVHLDDVLVLKKLEVLLEGFDGCDPLPVFCFLGNFTSGRGSSTKATMVGYFDELANVIAKFPRIAADGRFILVPGLEDVGLGAIVPRPPLPEYVTGSLRAKVRHIHFGSNPCRIRYFSREFVLGRLDVLNKLRRNCILLPEEGEELVDGVGGGEEEDGMMEDSDGGSGAASETNKSPSQKLIQHVVKTILDQGHLCPIPPSECPIYWQYDHALRLYPASDIVVLGDSGAERYSENYGDCDVMNPGSFYRDFGFLVYRPFGDEDDCDESGVVRSGVEFSAIDDN